MHINRFKTGAATMIALYYYPRCSALQALIGLCLLCVIFNAGGDDSGGGFQFRSWSITVRGVAVVDQPNGMVVRRIFLPVWCEEDDSTDHRDAYFASSTQERESSLKQLVISLLRGGHYDLTQHYEGPPLPPPPPPPPPPYPPLIQHHATNQDTTYRPIEPAQYTYQTTHQVAPEDQMQSLHPLQSDPPREPPARHPDAPPVPPTALLFPSGTWERYLRAMGGDVFEAQRRLTATLHWRMQNGMDDILSRPHPHIGILKRCYPHAYHLRGYQGEPVYYESPGKIDMDAMKLAGLTVEHLLRHYALVTEFIWTAISPHQDGPGSKGITVIDLDGVRLRDFVGDVVTFVKSAASFTGKHYPDRCGTIYVLNAPSFFQLIWRRVVAPLVDPATLVKVRVVDSNTLHNPYAIRDALMQTIPIENIPREYGGLSDIPIGFSPEEQMFRALIDQNNLEEGLGIETIQEIERHGSGLTYD